MLRLGWLLVMIAVGQAVDLSASINPDGTYSVAMDGLPWLASVADVAPVVAGNRLQILRRFNTTGTERGLGDYQGSAVEWGTAAPRRRIKPTASSVRQL